MNLREALARGAEILKASEIAGTAFDAQILLQYILKRDRVFFIREPLYRLSDDEEKAYLKVIDERAFGKPVSYITGEKEFMGLSFMVSEAVLIPRPDTETLVEEAIRLLKGEAERRLGERRSQQEWRKEPDVPGGIAALRALDMCTGSGAIGVSIAVYVAGVRVTAADISAGALEVAKINAVQNGVEDRVDFKQGNLFECIEETEKFDMIASNPPYISKAEVEELMTDVKDFEPRLALDGGEDGLYFYRKIIPEAAKCLNPGGVLIFEIGHDQGAAVSEMLNESGDFKEIRVLKDLAGLDRVVCAIYKP